MTTYLKINYLLLAFMLLCSTYASAQTYTTVNDDYVFQVLAEANNITIQSATEKQRIFETNATNKEYWSNAKNILATNPPIPTGNNNGTPLSALQPTIDYINEVVATMNTKL